MYLAPQVVTPMQLDFFLHALVTAGVITKGGQRSEGHFIKHFVPQDHLFDNAFVGVCSISRGEGSFMPLAIV